MHFFVFLFFGIVNSVEFDEFFNFGTSNGDNKLELGDDNYLGPITLQHSIKYFDHIHKKLYISNNGIVSFNRGVSEYIPKAFPLQNELFLAIYWADVDTRQHNSGYVYYRESTKDIDLRKGTNEIVKVFPSFRRTFSAEMVYIVTWDHVGYYSKHNDKFNTFQLIIVVDKESSFVIFNYLTGTDGITWTYGDASQGKHAHAGFNKGDGTTYKKVPGSGSQNIANIGFTSNINKEGKFIHKIDGKYIEPAPLKHDGPIIPEEILTTERFKVYDAIYNGNEQFISDITEYGLISYVNNTQILEVNKKRKGSRVCAVGPFKSGKTWLLKQLCNKNIPDGHLVKTVGISVVFNGDLLCIDTEGEHRVDEYERSKLRRATDRFHQEVALTLCDLVLIVIDGLTSYKRKYVDDIIKTASSLMRGHSRKSIVVVHNFKDFDDIKIVHSKIKNTILKAYNNEYIQVYSENGGNELDLNEWAYFQHDYSEDHDPENHSQAEVLTVNHFVFAKSYSEAGKFWNVQSFNNLQNLVKTVGFMNRGSLDVTKLITEGFTRLLPNYFLATDTLQTKHNDDGYNKYYDLWFYYKTIKTYTIDMVVTGIPSPRFREANNPYSVKLVEHKLFTQNQLRNLELVNKDKFIYVPYDLSENGEPYDGYKIACKITKNIHNKTLIVRCDIPGLEGTILIGGGIYANIKNNQPHVTLQQVGNRNTVIIRGIRTVANSDIEEEMFVNVQARLDGPFRYDFQLPNGYNTAQIERKQVSYDKGVLTIQIDAVSNHKDL